METQATLIQSAFPIIVAIFSIILHEIAHGYAAYVQGDRTAYNAGRLTLNPIPHIDLAGSVIVPLLAFLTAGTFFGWAKPVPYNVHMIKTRIGEAFVAAAGVLTNILIATLSVVALKVLSMQGVLGQGTAEALVTIMTINLSLAFFNLIPIPPFDGMSILQAFFPRLKIQSPLVYSPFYLVGAILLASVLYSAFIPHIQNFVLRLM